MFGGDTNYSCVLDAGYETLNKILNIIQHIYINATSKLLLVQNKMEKIKLKKLEEFLHIVIQYINIIYNVNTHSPVTLLGTPVQLLVNVNI